MIEYTTNADVMATILVILAVIMLPIVFLTCDQNANLVTVCN